MWVVKIVGGAVPCVFQAGYFPREKRYKKDAQKLAEEVVALGGKAVVEKVEKKKS